MSTTNAQKRKAAKRQARGKHIRKMANLRRSGAKPKYRLDVELDGQWREGVMAFRTAEQVEAYRKLTESRRAAGEEIAPGRVYSQEHGRFVVEIPGSAARVKGKLPDRITDGAKADPDVTAKAEERPVELVVETK